MENSELIQKLRPFVTDERFELLNSILSKRTRYMTLVLENMYHTHNASAVLRTCECFGIQDVNIVENSNQFVIHPDIVRGATKWLTVNAYNTEPDNTPAAFAELREKGYRIVATSPHAGNDVSLYDFDVTRGPFAIVMGSEKHGISDYAMQHADEFLKVPMVGFTESLNVSVCAAVVMSHLRRELDAKGIDAALSADERECLLVQWLLASIRSADDVLNRILSTE